MSLSATTVLPRVFRAFNDLLGVVELIRSRGFKPEYLRNMHQIRKLRVHIVCYRREVHSSMGWVFEGTEYVKDGETEYRHAGETSNDFDLVSDRG